MGEVEASLVGIDERAMLVDMVAEYLRRAQLSRCVAVWLRIVWARALATSSV